MDQSEESGPWHVWLEDRWVGRYTDEGHIDRSLYQSKRLFLAILSRFPNQKLKLGTQLDRTNILTIEDVYLNAPNGPRTGNYVVQIFDPFRASMPLFEKRYSTSKDAELELSLRLFQLDEIARNFTDDEWDAMARFFDYDFEVWVVRPE